MAISRVDKRTGEELISGPGKHGFLTFELGHVSGNAAHLQPGCSVLLALLFVQEDFLTKLPFGFQTCWTTRCKPDHPKKGFGEAAASSPTVIKAGLAVPQEAAALRGHE